MPLGIRSCDSLDDFKKKTEDLSFYESVFKLVLLHFSRFYIYQPFDISALCFKLSLHRSLIVSKDTDSRVIASDPLENMLKKFPKIFPNFEVEQTKDFGRFDFLQLSQSNESEIADNCIKRYTIVRFIFLSFTICCLLNLFSKKLVLFKTSQLSSSSEKIRAFSPADASRCYGIALRSYEPVQRDKWHEFVISAFVRFWKNCLHSVYSIPFAKASGSSEQKARCGF